MFVIESGTSRDQGGNYRRLGLGFVSPLFNLQPFFSDFVAWPWLDLQNGQPPDHFFWLSPRTWHKKYKPKIQPQHETDEKSFMANFRCCRQEQTKPNSLNFRLIFKQRTLSLYEMRKWTDFDVGPNNVPVSKIFYDSYRYGSNAAFWEQLQISVITAQLYTIRSSNYFINIAKRWGIIGLNALDEHCFFWRCVQCFVQTPGFWRRI